jgi:hypothetical protein
MCNGWHFYILIILTRINCSPQIYIWMCLSSLYTKVQEKKQFPKKFGVMFYTNNNSMLYAYSFQLVLCVKIILNKQIKNIFLIKTSLNKINEI